MPELVATAQLTKELENIISKDRSTPGSPLKNNVDIDKRPG